ncbi:MAG: polysaccharide deacetylase family protein [Candidatus Aquicultorales bacterium]
MNAPGKPASLITTALAVFAIVGLNAAATSPYEFKAARSVSIDLPGVALADENPAPKRQKERKPAPSALKEASWKPPASGEAAYQQRFAKKVVLPRSPQPAPVPAPAKPLPFGPVPPARIRNIAPGSMRVALTFDTERDAGYVPQILAALKAAGVKATFFIVGNWAEAYPSLAKSIAAAGHEIASHSYSHPMMTTIPSDAASAQLITTEGILYSITGQAPSRLFRPPYGDTDDRITAVAASLGFKTIMWSNDPHDWVSWQTGDNLWALVTMNLKDGDIILLHTSSKATGAAVPGILQKLKESGIKQVTVSELLK